MKLGNRVEFHRKVFEKLEIWSEITLTTIVTRKSLDMAGVKRKQVESKSQPAPEPQAKKVKPSRALPQPSKKPEPTKRQARPEPESESLVESDTSESENGFYGFSAKEDEGGEESQSSANDIAPEPKTSTVKHTQKPTEKGGKVEYLGVNGHLNSEP